MKEKALVTEAKKELEKFEFIRKANTYKINHLAFHKERSPQNIDPCVLLLRNICEDNENNKKENFKNCRLLEPCTTTNVLRILVFETASYASKAFQELIGADFAPKNLFVLSKESNALEVGSNLTIKKENWDFALTINFGENWIRNKLKEKGEDINNYIREFIDDNMFKFSWPVREIVSFKICSDISKEYFSNLNNFRNGFLNVCVFIEFLSCDSKHMILKELKYKQFGNKEGMFSVKISPYKGRSNGSSVSKIGNEGSKLVLKNLAFGVTYKELICYFADVKVLRLPKNQGDENKIKGYGFAEFGSVEDAKKVLGKLSELHFYGRKIVVEMADD